MREPLYLIAQKKLRDYIIERDLKPGAALPSEASLAAELGISRLSLREATKSLETLGIIRAVPGRGLFVREFSFDAILEQLPYGLMFGGRSLSELLQVREAIEAGLIVHVSQHMTEADLAGLEGLVRNMADAYERNESFAHIDRDFHVRLFDRLHNGLVTALVGLFWSLFDRMEGELPPGDAHSVEVHQDIIDAIRSGEPHRMTLAVHEHFRGVRESLESRTENNRPTVVENA